MSAFGIKINIAVNGSVAFMGHPTYCFGCCVSGHTADKCEVFSASYEQVANAVGIRLAVSRRLPVIIQIRFNPSPRSYYDLLRILVLTPFGGAIDAVAFSTFVGRYGSRFQTLLTDKNAHASLTGLAWACVTLAFVFFLPLMLTGLFSFRNWSRRLVPPSYIQLVGFLVTLLVAYPVKYIGATSAAYAIPLFMMCFGAQDAIGLVLFGRTGNPDDILRCSFRANCQPLALERIFLTERFREKLSLNANVRRTENGAIRLRTKPRQTYQVFVELEPAENPAGTIVNFAFAQIAKGYEFIKTNSLEEQVAMTISYIESFLKRPEYSVSLTVESAMRAEAVADYARHELHGVLDRATRIPVQVSFSVVGTVFLYALTLWLWVIGSLQEALAVLSIAVYFTVVLVFPRSA
jgi:hypothetical protein